ncbi:hypothetical protein JOC37_000721 [Desulfohalotomaculum tongense]|uniref:hypothetical protein n=1 Tax=Desulforadius tongensis TaxID=1216062 RepID=UPI001959BDD3|nr:hypothetical protein [Desulforadius tongensis]MBM7854348.1 hypothetical protein [Desulforadius tongensis]
MSKIDFNCRREVIGISSNITAEEYLAALIEVYRGYKVAVPHIDAEQEKSLLKDVLSSAIRFADSQQAMQAISEELFSCFQGNCSFEQQVELAQKQPPGILNAKMTAAAYVMKILK